MNRDRRIKPRKGPTTRAGADIIAAVVDAAARVLEDGGLDAFTTNRVAELAGVSIGSLYQYFPNKDALLAELARRMERHTEALAVEILLTSGAAPLAAVGARLIDALLGELGGIRLRQAIRRSVPPSWTAPVSADVDRNVRREVAAAMTSRADVRAGPHGLMAWIVVHAIEQVIEVAVVHEPELLAAPGFRAELIELVVRYLGRAAPAPDA
ncbi:MAG: helix-turn-helix transcriptional regulator [Myxococcales bacterium]|nr:helix-turn-helix transcriptional regulator [Myxococcales bacterium]